MSTDLTTVSYQDGLRAVEAVRQHVLRKQAADPAPAAAPAADPLLVAPPPPPAGGPSNTLSHSLLAAAIGSLVGAGAGGVSSMMSDDDEVRKNPLRRTLTGALFGGMTGGLGYPMVETIRNMMANRVRQTAATSDAAEQYVGEGGALPGIEPGRAVSQPGLTTDLGHLAWNPASRIGYGVLAGMALSPTRHNSGVTLSKLMGGEPQKLGLPKNTGQQVQELANEMRGISTNPGTGAPIIPGLPWYRGWQKHLRPDMPFSVERRVANQLGKGKLHLYGDAPQGSAPTARGTEIPSERIADLGKTKMSRGISGAVGGAAAFAAERLWNRVHGTLPWVQEQKLEAARQQLHDLLSQSGNTSNQ